MRADLLKYIAMTSMGDIWVMEKTVKILFDKFISTKELKNQVS